MRVSVTVELRIFNRCENIHNLYDKKIGCKRNNNIIMCKLLMALISEEPCCVREGAGGSVNLTVGRDEVCSGQLLLSVALGKLLVYIAERCTQRGRSGVDYLIRIGI